VRAKPHTKAESAAWAEGVRAAADYVSGFDKYVKHDFRLSDCILGKFNLMKRQQGVEAA
jgi:hypothetical protein